MREILFRGKPTEHFEHFKIFRPELFTGNFVIGSLVVCDDRYYICKHAMCAINSCVNNGMTTMIEVIPETVGQFTGLLDIFEDDIVYNGYGDSGIVKWVYGGFIIRFSNGDEWDISQYVKEEYTEVIGNIHDNPELLCTNT